MSGRGSSWKATAWAVDQKCGGPGPKAVLLVLASRCDENYSCFPGQELIAEETEQSVSTVRRQLKALDEAGLITRERRQRTDGSRTSDRYYLQVETAGQEQPVNLNARRANRSTEQGPTGQPDHDLPVNGDGAGTGQGNTPDEEDAPLGDAAAPAVEPSNGDAANDGGFACEGMPEPEPKQEKPPGAHDVTQVYVDAFREHAAGRDPLKADIGKVAKAAKLLLNDGVGFDVVKAAAARLGGSPFSDLYGEVRRALNGSGVRGANGTQRRTDADDDFWANTSLEEMSF